MLVALANYISRFKYGLIVLVILSFFVQLITPQVLASGISITDSSDLSQRAIWWNTSWRYRTEITVTAPAGTPLYDKQISTTVDWTSIFSSLGITGSTLDTNSLRLVEYTSAGHITYRQTNDVNRFETIPLYVSGTGNTTLEFVLPGTTSAAETRYFFLYFDTTDNSKSSKNYHYITTDTGSDFERTYREGPDTEHVIPITNTQTGFKAMTDRTTDGTNSTADLNLGLVNSDNTGYYLYYPFRYKKSGDSTNTRGFKTASYSKTSTPLYINVTGTFHGGTSASTVDTPTVDDEITGSGTIKYSNIIAAATNTSSVSNVQSFGVAQGTITVNINANITTASIAPQLISMFSGGAAATDIYYTNTSCNVVNDALTGTPVSFGTSCTKPIIMKNTGAAGAHTQLFQLDNLSYTSTSFNYSNNLQFVWNSSGIRSFLQYGSVANTWNSGDTVTYSFTYVSATKAYSYTTMQPILNSINATPTVNFGNSATYSLSLLKGQFYYFEGKAWDYIQNTVMNDGWGKSWNITYAHDVIGGTYQQAHDNDSSMGAGFMLYAASIKAAETGDSRYYTIADAYANYFLQLEAQDQIDNPTLPIGRANVGGRIPYGFNGGNTAINFNNDCGTNPDTGQSYGYAPAGKTSDCSSHEQMLTAALGLWQYHNLQSSKVSYHNQVHDLLIRMAAYHALGDINVVSDHTLDNIKVLMGLGGSSSGTPTDYASNRESGNGATNFYQCLTGTTYYAINVSSTTIKVATSLTNANNGTAIDITSAGSNSKVITSGGAFSISAVSTGTDVLTVGTNIATGTAIKFTTSGTVPGGLTDSGATSINTGAQSNTFWIDEFSDRLLPTKTDSKLAERYKVISNDTGIATKYSSFFNYYTLTNANAIWGYTYGEFPAVGMLKSMTGDSFVCPPSASPYADLSVTAAGGLRDGLSGRMTQHASVVAWSALHNPSGKMQIIDSSGSAVDGPLYTDWLQNALITITGLLMNDNGGIRDSVIGSLGNASGLGSDLLTKDTLTIDFSGYFLTTMDFYHMLDTNTSKPTPQNNLDYINTFKQDDKTTTIQYLASGNTINQTMVIPNKNQPIVAGGVFSSPTLTFGTDGQATELSNNTVSLSANLSGSALLSGTVSQVPMTITPSTSTVSVTMHPDTDLASNYYKWNMSSSGEPTVTVTVGNMPANASVQFLVDGNGYKTATTDNSGSITFNYTGGFSNHTFEINPVTSGSHSSSSITTGSTPGAATVCTDTPPTNVPQLLYAALPQNSSSVLLYFSDALGSVDHYTLEYGTSSNIYPYGQTNIGTYGIRTYLVKLLNPHTKYYFRVKAANGCASGPWSNEISTTTLRQSQTNTFVSSTFEPAAPETSPKPDDTSPTNTPSTCQSYTVKPGDTLWSIASQQLKDGSKYEQIISLNKETYPSLGTSHDLSIGWTLNLGCDQNDPTVLGASHTYDLNIKVTDTKGHPLKGIQVTVHSTPKQATTDKDGLAKFQGLEQGEHQILISSSQGQGEETINLSGDTKEFNVSIQLNPSNTFISPLALTIIGCLVAVIVVLVVVTVKKRFYS